MIDPLRYYNLETYLFEDIHRSFHGGVAIGAFELFSIIIWKANRAKTKLARRLLQVHGDLETAARKLFASLFRASSHEERLRLLIQDWGFYLPMASSILAVLWPDEFTIYDVRVCDELGDFRWVGNLRKPSAVWAGYQQYLTAVRLAVPGDLRLRDKDRYLWGRSAMRQLEQDLRRGFSPNPARALQRTVAPLGSRTAA